MGDGQQRNPGTDANAPLRVVRSVHRRYGRCYWFRYNSPRSSSSACALIAILLAPDLSGLLPKEWIWTIAGNDIQARWAVWLMLIHLSLSALCIFAIRAKRTKAVEVMLAGCAIWFALNGVDELLSGNLFGMVVVKYPILLAGMIATHYYIKRHDRSNK